MKQFFTITLCLCVCVSLLSSCGTSQDDYAEDWDDGYDTGYYFGFEEGYDEGRSKGYNEGYSDAELEYEDKYSEGYDDGYQAGATYTCMFFGDIERAFKCAKKGSAWYTLIDAYDQYVYDIYDDDDKETRSKLFWALVSYTSEDGATKEESKLLYSAFGSDLYYLDE